MAGELRIKAGTKLRMALDVPIGQTPDFCLVCTFVKALDTASFLISIPMQGGTTLPLDEEQKLLICFGSGADMQIVAGYADDIVKEGIRRCWKIRRVSEQRQFFRRSDERLRATIPIQYTQPTWPANEDGVIPPEEGREPNHSGQFLHPGGQCHHYQQQSADVRQQQHPWRNSESHHWICK